MSERHLHTNSSLPGGRWFPTARGVRERTKPGGGARPRRAAGSAAVTRPCPAALPAGGWAAPGRPAPSRCLQKGCGRERHELAVWLPRRGPHRLPPQRRGRRRPWRVSGGSGGQRGGQEGAARSRCARRGRLRLPRRGGGAQPAQREPVAREKVFSPAPGLKGLPGFVLSRSSQRAFPLLVSWFGFFVTPFCNKLRASRKPQEFCWCAESRVQSAAAGCC